MALIAATGYFDDSRTDGQVFTVAGFVGASPPWEQFEKEWPLMLARHDVPYFHMKEMADPNGQFKKWLPPQEHEAEVKAFFSDMASVIGECGFGAFGATVRIKDLERFNSEKGLELDPYSLAAYGCMVHIKQVYPTDIVNLFFDRIEKVKSRLDKAVKYAEADEYYTGVAGFIQPIPIQKNLTFRNIRPLQAADFLAWEARKHHVQQNEWWEMEDRPETWDARFQHYQEWSREKFGTRLPPPRKSLDALLKQMNFEGIVWDYRALNIAHEARGGVWACPVS
ncbi:MAG: hypothetical protein ACLPKB_35830 [Xanthobacteraceae bacterium]